MRDRHEDLATVPLRLDKAQRPCDSQSAMGALVRLKPSRKPLVLVVDDDPGVREALHIILEEEYAVVDAADGPAALAVVQSAPVDLVLLDILFPEGVDGSEILKEIKTVAPGTPVIMLTGVRTIQTTVSAMKLGAVDYVTKPFHEEELLGRIRSAIVRHPGPRIVGQRLRMPRRILVVDSDPGRRAALTVMLARLARAVMTAEGPAELDRVIHAPNLCVVLGLGPGRTALMQTVRSILARFPACPVVAGLESDDGDTVRELETLNVSEIIRRAVKVTDVVHRISAMAPLSLGPRHTPVRFSDSTALAIEYMGVKHAEKLSVAVIAAVVAVSGSRLAHVFRAETGLTVMDFVTRVRVELAKHLLITTAHSLAQIAIKVGFFDASHLSRSFLLTTGRRPGFYRQPSRSRA